MDHSVSQDTENLEFKRLCASGSSLAATALASTTTEAYGRAWGRFMGYCSEMGFDPLEVSGPVVATWVAHRAEETSNRLSVLGSLLSDLLKTSTWQTQLW